MLNPDFHDILSAFCEEGVEFLLVGAYALAVHGIPRATGDMDLWVRPSDENSEKVLRALEAFGAPLSGIDASDLKARDTVLQIGVVPRRIDILTTLDAVEFDDAWRDRTLVKVEGLTIPVIGRRDLIRNKKAVGRPQDLADVSRMEGSDG